MRTWCKMAVIGGMAVTVAISAAGCSGLGLGAGGHSAHHHEAEKYEKTRSPDILPKFLAVYTDSTAALYAEVDKHADYMKGIPCFCGCMDYTDPHESLYRCFVKSKTADTVEWTNHGATCGVCLMELKDIVEGVKLGKSKEQLKLEIEKKYKPAS